MKDRLYTDILSRTLLPFIREVYQYGHKLMQENDPKHTSCHTQQWIRDNRVNWWHTPAESLHMNPIENMWHELKEYICREVKPTTKNELVKGILTFGPL